MTLDLTGLPPTPAEVDAFLDDTSPAAYEKVVDRLLASPRYAERMAIRWLEAARYADTNGYQIGRPARHVALARLGDRRLPPQHAVRPVHHRADSPATCCRTPPSTRRSPPPSTATTAPAPRAASSTRSSASSTWPTATETTATVWLGLTLGCARCHDHKYDPITQNDFYPLFAFFNNVPEKGFVYNFGNEPPCIKAPLARNSRSS